MSHAFPRAHRRGRNEQAQDVRLPTSVSHLEIIETLGRAANADRFKARAQDGAPVTLYRISLDRSPLTAEHVERELRELAAAEAPHLLPINNIARDENRLWIESPFTGAHDGLVTLANLLPQKDGGQMSPDETERAVMHVLEGLRTLHDRGYCHGPLTLNDLVVDRRGSVLIELPGVQRRLLGLARGDAELVRDEIRTVGAVAYQLITGLEPGEPRIPAGRLIRKLPRAWNDWIEAAMDESDGFATAAEALDTLPNAANPPAATTPEPHDPPPAVHTRAANLLRRLPGVFR